MENFQYIKIKDSVEITKYIGESKTITIPKKIDGFLVTHIGSKAFSNNQLKSVEIPNSVTHIGDWAFYNNQLKSIEIPNSVTHIGVGAFSNNHLESVEIPNSVTRIGDYTFSNNQIITQGSKKK